MNIDIIADGSSQKPSKTYAHYAEVQASKKISSIHSASSTRANSAEVFFPFVLQVVRAPEPQRRSSIRCTGYFCRHFILNTALQMRWLLKLAMIFFRGVKIFSQNTLQTWLKRKQTKTKSMNHMWDLQLQPDRNWPMNPCLHYVQDLIRTHNSKAWLRQRELGLRISRQISKRPPWRLWLKRSGASVPQQRRRWAESDPILLHKSRVNGGVYFLNSIKLSKWRNPGKNASGESIIRLLISSL